MTAPRHVKRSGEHESIGKLVLKRPQKKEAVRDLLVQMLDGHKYPPVRVLLEWDGAWDGVTWDKKRRGTPNT